MCTDDELRFRRGDSDREAGARGGSEDPSSGHGHFSYGTRNNGSTVNSTDERSYPLLSNEEFQGGIGQQVPHDTIAQCPNNAVAQSFSYPHLPFPTEGAHQNEYHNPYDDAQSEHICPVIPTDSRDICNFFLENAMQDTIDNTVGLENAFTAMRQDVNDAIEYHGGSIGNSPSILQDFVAAYQDDLDYNSAQIGDPPQDCVALNSDYCMQFTQGSVDTNLQTGNSVAAMAHGLFQSQNANLPIPMSGKHHPQPGRSEPPQAINSCASYTLRQWINHEKMRSRFVDFKASLLERVAVAYGIGKLIESCNDPIRSISSDNFAVRVRETYQVQGTHPESEVVGVDLISQKMSANLSYIQRLELGSEESNSSGRLISATISTTSTHRVQEEQGEALVCCAFGQLLHFLFSGEEQVKMEDGHECDSKGSGLDEMFSVQPAKRQTRDVSFSQASISESSTVPTVQSRSNWKRYVDFPRPPSEFGCPSSIAQLIGGLLSCGDGLFCSDTSFKNLKEATDEIHLLLEDPRFLFQSVPQLLSTNKVFGRSEEMSIIIDAYQRVASTGRGEAIVIGGYSGSGKSRLVQKVIESLDFAGDALTVSQKFQENSSRNNSSSVVLKALDEMCIRIAQNVTMEQKRSICKSLNREFGQDAVRFLASVIPNVMLFLSHDSASFPYDHQVNHDVNFISMCFTLQRFIRVISRSVRTCMLILLDDLQWADPMSLGLMHSLLSNVEGDSMSLLFVGTYRNNATLHAQLISDFLSILSRLDIRFTRVKLDGLPPNDVTLMISDALGIVPRICSALSSIVYKKTKGNPFFVKEFLRSLVDKGLIAVSLREQCWLWDIDNIATQPVTDNVLELIMSKMLSVDEDVQTALKVISCFGCQVSASVVNALSSTDKFSKLLPAMDKAEQDGFIDFNEAYYRFVHDSIRESAYALIDDSDVKSYHYEIGIALYPSCMKSRVNDENNEMLFSTLGQINYGAESMLDSQPQRISVAQLNLEAGMASMKGWNFLCALTYLKAAHSLLPPDSWDREDTYLLSLNVHYSKAKAAYPSGEIETAKASLQEIDSKAKCLEDRLDAAHLLVEILHHCQEDRSQAFDICCKMLNLLGQNVPYENQLSATKQLIQLAQTRLNSAFTSDEDYCNMKYTENKRINDIMRFYAQLTLVSYTKGGKHSETRGWFCGYYISRWVTYFLEQKVVCSYTADAISCYSAALSYGFDTRNCTEGLRLGKIALMYLDQNKDGINKHLPGVYLTYYGFVGILKEPIQYCILQHRKAFDIGMRTGNTSDAFFNLAFMIPRMLDAGENLLAVKREILFYQQLGEKHYHPVLLKYMECNMDAITPLVDEGQIDIVSPEITEKTGITDATAIHIVQLLIPACYLGHTERVLFLCKKWESLELDARSKVPMRIILVAFYQGLACAASYLKKKSKSLLSKLESSIEVLKKASGFSEWNFANKMALLEAEMLSILCRNAQSEEKYACAIKRAQVSKFINEEGLACELAAKHYLRTNDHEMARSLFGQAEKCYRKWGSAKKAKLMVQAMEQIA